MKKIIIESDDVNTTSTTRIDLTEYTEMVIKMTIDGMLEVLKEKKK